MVFTRHTPLPWEDGAGAYLFDILKFLSGFGYEIHVAWLEPHERLRWMGVWIVPKFLHEVLTLHLPRSRRVGRSFWFQQTFWLPAKARLLCVIKKWFQKFGLMGSLREEKGEYVFINKRDHIYQNWMSLPSAAERAFAREVAYSVKPNVVIACYPWMIPLLDGAGFPVQKRICLHYDIAWQRAELNCQLSRGTAEITRTEEAELLDRSDLIVDISERDREEAGRMARGAETLLIPKGMIARQIIDPHNRVVLFVGSGNAYNVEGLKWLLDHVWPACATLSLGFNCICGSINQQFLYNTAGVRFFGVVQDLSSYYANATIVVVPFKRQPDRISRSWKLRLMESQSLRQPLR